MKNVLLVILDGFGIREETDGNAVNLAKMPFFNNAREKYPNTLLEASGEYVGLPHGQFGNSEICHTVIGLGKVIKQKLTIINEEVKKESFKENKNFVKMLRHLENHNGTLHLMGLTSDGGVHSDISYIRELLPRLKENGINKIHYHAITDGRDTAPNASLVYLDEINNLLKDLELGTISTVSGRYYAMDRDRNFDRTYHYYKMVVNGDGFNVNDYRTAVINCYKKELYDEFIPPFIAEKDSYIKENDAVLWLNFRQDRSIQIVNSLSDSAFEGFQTSVPLNVKVFTMFDEEDIKNVSPLFTYEREDLYPIGEYLSELNLTQARIAETEKYSHVTKFFNAEKTDRYVRQRNYLVNSPKVTTYDKKPEMSSTEVTNETIKAMNNDYDFILVNYANPDMVGHTGNLEATIVALEHLDGELERLYEASKDNFYKMIITSDHGNADTMVVDNRVVTTHSTARVPFIMLDDSITLRRSGDLTNIAPTILDYIDIAIPKTMDKKGSLINKDD